MTSIEVGVRVRPFNSREIKYNSQLIIAMPNETTCEVRGGGTVGAAKKFFLDHCLWTFQAPSTEGDEAASGSSTSGTTATEGDGSGSPLPFANQLHVYNAIGKRILDNALQGFNACLFAYGQTGSGKTFTMMGTQSDPGIIPRLTQDMFERERLAGSSNADPFQLSIEVTYLEIYNESVKDLLNAKGLDKALRVRQHPTFGVYVEGLSKWSVRTEADVLKLLDDGASVRSVAATKMNATSSRSHAILTLHIKKKTMQAEFASQLHLVDLAGSERASSTGAEGDTLLEGANINKSLSTLGMCLSRLAEASSGGAKGHVPYRDSQLTWLLNDSLGGNSKTAMLANISPASINAEETLSTLRFASTVKKIKNHATVNEDPQQRLIRELRAEIEEIKQKILALESGLPEEVPSSAPPPVELSVDRDSTSMAPEATTETGSAVEDEGVQTMEPEHLTDATQTSDEAPSSSAACGDALAHQKETVVTDQQTGDGIAADDIDLTVPAKRTNHVETHEELLERLEEDTTLMLQIAESAEEAQVRTQVQTEENLKAMKELNDLQVTVKLSCPRLITLNEDLHCLPSVALLYYLHEGDTWCGDLQSGEDDGGPPVAICLPSVASRPGEVFLPRHCRINVNGLTQQAFLHVAKDDRPATTDGSDAAAPNPSSTTSRPARVYVNGILVAAGTSRRLRHSDRIVVGLMAYRHSQPARWFVDTLRDDFIRYPLQSVTHAFAIERLERLEVELEMVRELRQQEGELALRCPAGEADLHATHVALLSRFQEETVTILNQHELHLAEMYPMTQQALMSAAAAVDSASSLAALDYDYEYAMQEVRTVLEAQRKQREQEHKETMEKLKKQTEDRDAEIASLKEELLRQEAAKRSAQISRLVTQEAESRDVLESEVYDALKEVVEQWRISKSDVKRRVEERRRREADERKMTLHLKTEMDRREVMELEEAAAWEHVQVMMREQQKHAAAQVTFVHTPLRHPQEHHTDPMTSTVDGGAAEDQSVEKLPATTASAAAAAPARTRRNTIRAQAPSRQVDAMLQLAADVRQYEEECRDASLWKPNGPTHDEDKREYLFSITSPTVQAVQSYYSSQGSPSSCGLEGVLHEQDAWKLRRGFLGRQSYRVVHIIVRPRFLYYFASSDEKSPALGAAFLYGASIERSCSGTIDGKKYVLRIVPSVPRKPTKSSKGSTEENTVTFGFDTEGELDVLTTLVRRLAAPECPLSVKQFYAQQQQQQQQIS